MTRLPAAGNSTDAAAPHRLHGYREAGEPHQVCPDGDNHENLPVIPSHWNGAHQRHMLRDLLRRSSGRRPL